MGKAFEADGAFPDKDPGNRVFRAAAAAAEMDELITGGGIAGVFSPMFLTADL